MGSILYFRDLQGPLDRWFRNFSGERTTQNILVLCEAQNIDFYRDWRTS
jgi:hypothetical protein